MEKTPGRTSRQFNLNTKSIFALDLGTTKFCLAHVAFPLKFNTNLLDLCITPADGMHRGMVSNKSKVAECLDKLLIEFEKKYNLDVREIVVGIAGSHLKSQKLSVTKSINKAVATQKDILELAEIAKSRTTSNLREQLHIVPLNYRIDGRQAENPVGCHGTQISCEFFIIDADKCYLKDVVDVCNKSGLVVKRFYSEPFASASVVLAEAIKSSGSCIIDIGGGSSDGIVYFNNHPLTVFTVNIAGKMMTNDLSIGLGISVNDAEYIKHRLSTDFQEFPVCDLFGKQRIITRAECMRILLPRIKELAYLIHKEITPFKKILNAGLILTGGASELSGLTQIFEDTCKLPTRRSQPQLNVPSHDHSSHLGGPMSTVMGLIKLELNEFDDSIQSGSSLWANRIFGGFLSWLRELY